MNILQHTDKYARFTTNAHTAHAKHFRIYDCFERGYVIMLNGKVIGIADNIVLAQHFAINYKGV